MENSFKQHEDSFGGQTPEPITLPPYSQVLITVYLCLLYSSSPLKLSTAYFNTSVLLSKTQTIVNIYNIFATKKLKEQSKSLVYNLGKNSCKRKPCYKH